MMNNLITIAKKAIRNQLNLHFSVYASHKEQMLTNVPIIKPLLIFILSGVKQLSQYEPEPIKCLSGSFVFLSNSPRIGIRNIPVQDEYFALIIDFDYEDFADLPKHAASSKKYFQGNINPLLEHTLCQFIELSSMAPAKVIRLRKKEILEILYHSGYKEVCHIIEPPSLSAKIETMISSDVSFEWRVDYIASKLFMSISTLRRKLKIEENSIQDIRNRVRLGQGLHLLQTTQFSIGMIATQCGYQSQSRFTDQFKLFFGMTPREIRKTKISHEVDSFS